MVKLYKIDRMLIIITSLLVLIGLIMVYSSTHRLAFEQHHDSLFYLKKQLKFLVLGLLAAVIISSLKNPLYLNTKLVMGAMLIAIIGLSMVFITGRINNSFRWIRVGGFSIQPSEYAKIAVVLYLAFILSRKTNDINDIRKLLVLMIPVFVVELLILKEPDLGNFMLILAITLIMLFLAGLRLRYFGYFALIMIPCMILIFMMNPDKMNRITAFLSPTSQETAANFQVHQSIYAVGSGGIFGKGLGKSTQKLFFLPYAYSDFIYSIIGEEVGFVGASSVVVLFFLFMIRGLNVAKQSGYNHTYLLVTGLTFLIVLQAMINISVTLGVFPTKGIPLPFISNGGSSLVACLIIAGIILNVSRHRKMVLAND